MGTFSVPVTVGNPDSAAREKVDALVDTGSTFSVMPASLLQRLGIEPTWTRRLRLANGEVEVRQTGLAFFEVNGMAGAARVVLGPENLHILGANTLEDLSFVVDPINKRLIAEDALLMWGTSDDIC